MKTLVLAAALVVAPVLANADVTFAPASFTPEAQLERMKTQLTKRPSQSKRQYVAALMALSGEGYATQDMVDAAAKRQLAQRRAMLLSTVYQNDLDGDGIVTREEIETGNKAARINRRNVDAVMILYSHDLDEDGALSFHEVLSYASKESKAKNSRADLQHQMLMGMDMNADGQVTIPEVMGYIDAAVQEAETAKAQKAQGMVPKVVDE